MKGFLGELCGSWKQCLGQVVGGTHLLAITSSGPKVHEKLLEAA